MNTVPTTLHSPISIITIDGPAGVGKTSLAQAVADNLNMAYLDTGAMFRCLALKLGEGAHLWSEEVLCKQCAQWNFSLDGCGANTVLLCNGVAVRDEIRTEEVALLASQLATVPIVRHILKDAQRQLGKNTALVTEGRDMGSVVFPTAQYKFFLDASPEVRALRRLRQLQAMGEHAELTLLTEQIRKRDTLDRNRATAPLRPAADAILIDTTQLSLEEVLARLLQETLSTS